MVCLYFFLIITVNCVLFKKNILKQDTFVEVFYLLRNEPIPDKFIKFHLILTIYTFCMFFTALFQSLTIPRQVHPYFHPTPHPLISHKSQLNI